MSKYSTIVGLDLGDRYSHFCVMDPDGEIVEQGRLRTTRAALLRKFGAMERARVAMEVCTYSPWVSRQLKGYGHEVLVANPRKVALIYGSMRKRDEIDAESLARLARLDPQLLSPIEHRGLHAQQDMAMVRAREVLVKARTQLVNSVRSVMKSMGYRAVQCSTDCFHRKVLLQLPAVLTDALAGVVTMIGELSAQIAVYDKMLAQLAQERYPETVLLQQVTAVGPLTALAYVLTVEDPYRFAKSRSVGAYLGLVPKQSQSGQSDPQLRISKTGSRLVRRLLVGSAHYIMGPFGPDTELRRWGLAMAERGGKNAKKRAVVAVARKLAVLLHKLWITGQVYEPLGYSDKKAPLAVAACDETNQVPFSATTAGGSD